MGPRTRRTCLVAAVAAVMLAFLVPGAPALRRDSATGGISVLIRFLDPGAKARTEPVAAPTVASAAPRIETALVERPAPAALKSKAQSDVEPAPVEVDPGIRVLDQDTFGDPPPPPPNGPCAKASTCPSHELRPARWKTDKTGQATITWKFNDEGRRNLRSPAGLLESAVRSSMSEWSRWNSNITFRYDGLTTATFGAIGKDKSCADGTNVVTWDRYDPQVIAQAGLCLDRTGRIIQDADLAMNVTYHWENIVGEPKSRHSFDIRSIATHELGHWLGLLDLYSPNDTKQTMSGFSEYGEVSKRTLALGDIIAIQKAYPCGDGKTCPRKGIVND